MNLSQTQLSNIASIAGLIVLISSQFNFVLDQSQVTFIIAAIWSLSWTAYNYYNRFQKGDIKVLGGRK